ncbi:MAG: PaaI family thioesterase [Anaerolineae bacterium]
MERQPSSRTCFLCGRQNEIGLKMTWYNDLAAGQVRATVTIPEHFNGYPGFAHGGIIAALLDETAGRALLLEGSDEDLMVTLKLTVRYRRPTPTGEPLTVAGWVVRRTPLRATVAAQILLADGTVSAEGEAIVVRPPEEFFRRWEPEKPFWRVYED